jgi:hypothetical protein
MACGERGPGLACATSLPVASGKAEIASEGGAGRRSANNAAARINWSREAHLTRHQRWISRQPIAAADSPPDAPSETRSCLPSRLVARTAASARSTSSSSRAAGSTCTSAPARDDPPRGSAVRAAALVRWWPVALAGLDRWRRPLGARHEPCQATGSCRGRASPAWATRRQPPASNGEPRSPRCVATDGTRAVPGVSPSRQPRGRAAGTAFLPRSSRTAPSARRCSDASSDSPASGR